MSTTVQELRNLQVEIRRVQTELGVITNELRTHPDKPKHVPGVSIDPATVTKWNMTKATIEAKKTPLQLKLLELQNRRDVLSLSLAQEPVSTMSLSRIIEALIEIESRFTANSAEDAWEALTAFIDHLEYDEKRVNVEQQVEKLENQP
jgi:hypothetical protein